MNTEQNGECCSFSLGELKTHFDVGCYCYCAKLKMVYEFFMLDIFDSVVGTKVYDLVLCLPKLYYLTE